jgi:hypothetical protein
VRGEGRGGGGEQLRSANLSTRSLMRIFIPRAGILDQGSADLRIPDDHLSLSLSLSLSPPLSSWESHPLLPIRETISVHLSFPRFSRVFAANGGVDGGGW